MIIREQYLSEIRPFYNQDLIKIIKGIRRCGKSVILLQIMDELKNRNISYNHIIYINFESKEFSFIKNDDDLYSYVKNKIVDDERYYMFFDEIQNVCGWEKAINSFKSEGRYSIFITGSNSDLLSSEFATHLAGRYVSFNIYPFSFKEVCELKKVDDKNKFELEELFMNYIEWGGMPQRFAFDNVIQVRTYLSDIYDSIVIKDIISRFGIKDLDLFNRIVEYIVTTPSQTFSAENLVKYFNINDDRGVTKNTLYNYLEYMSKAMLISKADRYDVRGKRILSGKYKYYLTDLGLGQVMNINKKQQMGAYLENVVYNELLMRGYDVKIGSLDNGEVDFVATKYSEKLYFQVTYILADESVINREFGAFQSINDNYPKYVISMDKFDFSQEGIIHKNIIDWLLDR
ncbi:MAG: ATP-binding protein [Bacilli bacterium]|nr:ATP-binding protein [Bacilli bacterium]MCI9434627.1 ATP-binding protein [Bacilli bacterium]